MVHGQLTLTVLAWAAFAYALVLSVRYLFGVRAFLTSAYRDVQVEPITAEQIEPGWLPLLTWHDGPLAAAGFRHLGFLRLNSFLTYYDKTMSLSVFVNQTLPAYAVVRPCFLPEYATLAELHIQTTLESGLCVATVNTPVSLAFLPPDMKVAAVRGAKVAALVEMHQRRVAAESVRSEPVKHPGLEHLKDEFLATLRKLRAQLRERGWIVPTVDPSLDRYTLRGAFALTHYSRRAIGARTGNAQAVSQPGSPSDRQLRIDADMLPILMFAENPEVAPGRPWPLITMVIATALLSFVAMATLWNAYVATLVLAAVAFHEGGHAIAMRSFGYRDVHIFFVPLLGAMTVGRATIATVRDRIAMLLAGPLPGLWLGLVLFTVDRIWYPSPLLRMSARILLILNGLNLLPFTPLDGGRALEVLTRPESVWRLIVHIASAIGLVTIAILTRDPLMSAFGAFWLAMVPRQWQAWQLRRQVAAAAHNSRDFLNIVRITLEVIAVHPRYASLRAGARQMTARTLGRAFSESVATPADRTWGAIAYASAWIPVVAWLMLG